MAQRNSPGCRRLRRSPSKQRAAAHAAHAYTNPSLEVFEGQQYARPVATPGVPGLLQHYAAYQTIEIPSSAVRGSAPHNSAIASSRFGQQAVTLSVVADVKHAFYNALRRREEIDHAQENLQLVEDLRRRVEVSVNVGEEGRLELTRAEAELGRAQFAVTQRATRVRQCDCAAASRHRGAGDATSTRKASSKPRIIATAAETATRTGAANHPVLAAVAG